MFTVTVGWVGSRSRRSFGTWALGARGATAVGMLVLLTAVVAAASAQQRVVPDGYYIPEQLPRAFTGLHYIELRTTEPGPPPDYAPRKIPLEGRLLVGRRSFPFRRVSINGLDVTFETASVAGTSYVFTGRFTRGGAFAEEMAPEGVILRGQLQKRVGARVAGQAELSFTYSLGD